MTSTGTNNINLPPICQKLTAKNEQIWLKIGSISELMNDNERALKAYESALRHNPDSIQALKQIAALCRQHEEYHKAIEYFQKVVQLQPNDGETWGALGHCYLMVDDLQKAHLSYQNALQSLPNPREPKLWYGIGILYDRYGSNELAEASFSNVLKMDKNFDKANEIYFRLGIIYKLQQKYDLSLQCFQYILNSPPKPLTDVDVLYQIGHVYEQKGEYINAKEAYEKVLRENPNHSKVLQQLGWLYYQSKAPFCNQELAMSFLSHSLEAEPNDALSWYYLGRCHMSHGNHNKAYDSYQQAVYRDSKNPLFWCSIGVLYYKISQYRDSLDAYSRAIKLNPYISEVWYNLGTLYETSNNQINDALDAYQKAAELDPNNQIILHRLEFIRKNPGELSPPTPMDVDPYKYQNATNQNSSHHENNGPNLLAYNRINDSQHNSMIRNPNMYPHRASISREIPLSSAPNRKISSSGILNNSSLPISRINLNGRNVDPVNRNIYNVDIRPSLPTPHSTNQDISSTRPYRIAQPNYKRENSITNLANPTDSRKISYAGINPNTDPKALHAHRQSITRLAPYPQDYQHRQIIDPREYDINREEKGRNISSIPSFSNRRESQYTLNTTSHPRIIHESNGARESERFPSLIDDQYNRHRGSNAFRFDNSKHILSNASDNNRLNSPGAIRQVNLPTLRNFKNDIAGIHTNDNPNISSNLNNGPQSDFDIQRRYSKPGIKLPMLSNPQNTLVSNHSRLSSSHQILQPLPNTNNSTNQQQTQNNSNTSSIAQNTSRAPPKKESEIKDSTKNNATAHKAPNITNENSNPINKDSSTKKGITQTMPSTQKQGNEEQNNQKNKAHQSQPNSQQQSATTGQKASKSDKNK